MTEHFRPSQFRSPRRQSASLRAIVPVLMFAALAAGSGRASAQELNTPGNLVFGAERLFGFYLDKQSFDAGNIEGDEDTTGVGLGLSFTNPGAVLSFPRVGVDYFIDEHLTLGGNFGLASLNVEDNDNLAFLITGRVGYALRLTHAISFWPRGGLTFGMINGEGNDDRSVFGLTLEGMFTIAPSDGWAILAGPLLDLGFIGGAGDDVDHSEILFGIMFGLAGWVGV
jgi:hypothetical protein